MTLPDVPDEAVEALYGDYAGDAVMDWTPEDWAFGRESLATAWPYLYAAALRDFADRMDRTLETVGAGEDPATAYRFVVGCARSLADDAVNR